MSPTRTIRAARAVLLAAAGLAFAIGTFTVRGIDWKKEQEFWSFKAPERHARPVVKQTSWPAQPIDFFVLAALETKGLEPSPAAGRAVLLRRATFDLTGLPPTPEESARFLADTRPDAYERLIDRLLNQRAFGERLASLWLPLARYAEDQAHQVGNDTKFFYPNAFLYRAWVIDAFNQDLPYDRFLRLQLAADLESGSTQEDMPALGFLGLGPKYYNRNRIEVMADEWEDRVDTVSRAMLGLTVACARCHDHKFDPITQEDYYALAGIFASTRMANKSACGEVEEKEASAEKMKRETLHMVEEGEPKDLNVFLRGNPERKGDVVARRFLRVLSENEPKPFAKGSGRLELAAAIADSNNPLTARVAVNRLWAAFFGEPLVGTPSNFGHSGQSPSHPLLLDDLAVRFTENGWSVKRLVKEFVMSSTYRQSSTPISPKGSSIDPENRLLWKMPRKRLSVEQWRDAVLAVTGELSTEGGKSLELNDPANVRRTVYGRVSRLELNPTLMQFDYPDANVHAERRPSTTTPTQKLFVLNSPFMLARANALAARLPQTAALEERLEAASQLVYGRECSPHELAVVRDFLAGASDSEYSPWAQYCQMLLASNEFAYVD